MQHNKRQLIIKVIFFGFISLFLSWSFFTRSAQAIYIKGDVDLSGSLTYLDADIMSQYAVGLRTLTDEQKLAADMSGDGQVTSYDAALLLQEIKGNGDVNGDGAIDQEDAQYINDVVVGKSSFTANQKTVGDMSGDGTITSHDAALLQQWTSTIVVEAGSTSVAITWTTPRSSDSRAEYGTTNALGLNARDAVMVTNHRLSLDGLTAGTTYSFRIRSQDSAGNTMVSEIKTFTTAAISTINITITSPQGGDQWQKGKSYRIEWSAPASLATVDISLDTGIRCIQAPCPSAVTIVKGMKNTGSYAWTVPETLSESSAYRVEVVALDESRTRGVSDYFSIVAQSPAVLTVFSPAAGNTWVVGKEYAIRWSPPYVVTASTEVLAQTLPTLLPQRVSITLAPYYACWNAVLPCAVPMIAPYTITSNVPNTGSYMWKIPPDLPQPYTGTQRITVTLNDTDLRGTSAPFTIARLRTVTNKPPVISVVSGPTSLRVNEMGKWTVVAYDLDGTYLDYGVDWGDRAPQPEPLGEMAPLQKLTQEATFTHSYSSPGRYKVEFAVRDDERGAMAEIAESTLTVEVGGAVSTNGQPHIGPIAIPVEIAAGDPVTLYLSAQDPDGDYMSWGVSWGDGVGEAGACPASTPGTSFKPTHTWVKPGTYTVGVSVDDCRGGQAYTSFPIIVVGRSIPVPTPTPLPGKSQPIPIEEKEGLIRALRDRIKKLEIKVSELEGQVIEAEKRLTKAIDRALTQRVAGNILLQVEENGESWYVDPVTEQRYYLKDGGTAYAALQAFGLGIKNNDLEKIPVGIEKRAQDVDSDADGLPDKLEEAIGTNPMNADSDGDRYPDGFEVENGYSPVGLQKFSFNSALANRLEGRVLLQVEGGRGQAWYIHDGKRYYMKDGDSAYQIMRFLSLGITNENLRKIAVGEFK